jgi:glycine cleavage system regulatory protein
MSVRYLWSWTLGASKGCALLSAVDAHGLEVRIVPAVKSLGATGEALEFSLVGQDRPGIVNQVTEVLSRLDANIETFETRVTEEPHSGAALFHMETRLRLPVALEADDVRSALEEISAEIMVDISVAPVS